MPKANSGSNEIVFMVVPIGKFIKKGFEPFRVAPKSY
tara:strand:+ start:1842 stop:1952 length:111 start_codon:yes stop_codon:yes gene_type:complete